MVPSLNCGYIRDTFGSTTNFPDEYTSRSLISFTDGHLAPLLVFQGMNDAQVQVDQWPDLKSGLGCCTYPNLCQFSTV